MSDVKLQPIHIQNTQDLRQFMLQLKAWAEAEKEMPVYQRVCGAESRGVSASELISEYGLALKDVRQSHRARLPLVFQSQLENGIAVAEEGVSLGSPLLAMKRSK